jgi:hypothetical protein
MSKQKRQVYEFDTFGWMPENASVRDGEPVKGSLEGS